MFSCCFKHILRRKPERLSYYSIVLITLKTWRSAITKGLYGHLPREQGHYARAQSSSQA